MPDRQSPYLLMHKNTPVAHLILDAASSAISSITHVYAPEHVPVGVHISNGKIDRTELNEWWQGRAIPASRAGLKNALIELNVSTTKKLVAECLGLSLSDQYWICPENIPLRWSDINFFQNPFSEDVGNILFGQADTSKRINLMSPDNTSDGWLQKKWKIIHNKRCLIKGGSGAIRQEPYNEVIASKVMQRLGIEHVEYALLIQGNEPFSVCADFITPQTELISAWHIMQTMKKPNHISVYQHYVDCCTALGIPDITQALDRMIVIDYLIANEDRHQNNFGVVRDAETLSYIGAAPIYDSGTSLWFNKPTPLIKSDAKLNCKPFKSTHEEQIKLVSSFDWLDLSALTGIDEEIHELVRDSIFIDEARCDALCAALNGRIHSLEQRILSFKTTYSISDITGDVTQDIAYSGLSTQTPPIPLSPSL